MRLRTQTLLWRTQERHLDAPRAVEIEFDRGVARVERLQLDLDDRALDARGFRGRFLDHSNILEIRNEQPVGATPHRFLAFLRRPCDAPNRYRHPGPGRRRGVRRSQQHPSPSSSFHREHFLGGGLDADARAMRIHEQQGPFADRGARLLHAHGREVGVFPAGEQVLQVPVALAVADENKRAVH